MLSMKRTYMKQTTQATTPHCQTEHNATIPVGGLAMRTDLRAGLAWDDLNDKAQELWGNLTNAVSNLASGTDSSS